MKIKNTKILRLPAYTTILCQTFSSDGNYLAVGSDFGRIAIYKISTLVSEGRNSKDKTNDLLNKSTIKKNSSLFYFDVGSNDVLATREIYKVLYCYHSFNDKSVKLNSLFKIFLICII